MADAYLPCVQCGTPIGSSEVAHLFHENCDRFLGLECRCDEWVCAQCCPDEECTPLQTRLLEAREELRLVAEEWEAAQKRSASTVRVDDKAAVPYFGWIG